MIFQDFVRYDMRFDENIGVGEIEGVHGYLAAVRDAPENGHRRRPPRSSDASERSLASTLLPRFARGYRQMLGRRFDDGVDLRAASGRRSRWRARTCARRRC